jgi:hypothetical protein
MHGIENFVNFYYEKGDLIPWRLLGRCIEKGCNIYSQKIIESQKKKTCYLGSRGD